MASCLVSWYHLRCRSKICQKDSFFLHRFSGKLEKPPYRFLVEAMFANIVVNTAVLVSMRMKDDAGKSRGHYFSLSLSLRSLVFEHVIANFPAFSLAYFASNGAIEAFTAGNVIHNLFWAFIGNFIGGGLIMGLGYAWLDKDNKNLTYF